MTAADSISNLRAQLAARRIVRQRNRKLESELASYSTPADRLELEAILSRHTAEEIEELEALLSRPSRSLTTHLG